jgi:two-component system, chemotaxis family, chemotaxis protein CheY
MAPCILAEYFMRDVPEVLVVDDSIAACRAVAKLLRQCGVLNVEQVQTGAEALQRLAGAKFDAVICDYVMAPMSGLDVLAHVRGDADLRETPFILMSATKDPRWIAQASRLGADCMIAKPFDAATLQQKMRQLGFAPKPAPAAPSLAETRGSSAAPEADTYHKLDA